MNGLQAKVENYLNNLEGRIKPSSLTYDGVGGSYFKPEIKQKILNSCQDFVVFNLRSFSDKVLDGELNEGFYWVTRGREIFLELAGNQDFTGKLFVKFSSWVMPMKIYDITGIISSFVPSRLGDRDYFLVIASQIVRDKSSIRNFDGRDEWYLNLNDNNSWKILNCDELKEKLDRVIIPPKTSDMNKKKFYNKGGEYFEFTNFFPAPFTICEIPPNLGLSPYLIGDWETSEHLFQAAKFNDQAIIEEIRQTTTAR